MLAGRHRQWAFPVMIALVVVALVAFAPFRCGIADDVGTTDDSQGAHVANAAATAEQQSTLQEMGNAAVAAREQAVARAVTVLNEGPELHSNEELGVAVKLLGELGGDTWDSTWALLNYLTYRFPPPAEWSTWAWVPLDVRAEHPSASMSLSSIGLRAVPCLVSRLAETDDTGMRHACMQLLAGMLGKHAIPVLESAIQQTPDPKAQARLKDIVTRHRGYFVGGGCFMLPPPYRGPVPEW